MSTLCRAERKWQKNAWAAISAPKAFGVLPSPFFCLPERVNGLEKISDDRKYFGNISEKPPFSERISDYFFGKGGGWVKVCQSGPARRSPESFSGRRRVKPSRKMLNLVNAG
jgi:hypothetical protein